MTRGRCAWSVLLFMGNLVPQVIQEFQVKRGGQVQMVLQDQKVRKGWKVSEEHLVHRAPMVCPAPRGPQGLLVIRES